MSVTTELPSTHFLTALPAAVRIELERLAIPKDYRPGMALFQESAPHDDIYLIVAGRVRLEMIVPGRGRQSLMTVGPGDIVG